MPPELWQSAEAGDLESIGLALGWAAGAGDLAGVERALALGDSGSRHFNTALCYGAVCGGHAKVVARLLADPRADPAFMESESVKAAAALGHAAIVAMLLADGRADPAKPPASRHAPGALEEAALGGHVDVVALLMEDPRVDPAALEAPGLARVRADPRVAAALARRARWSPLRGAFLHAWARARA